MTEIKRCLDCLYYPMCKEIAAGNCTLASEACTCFVSTDGWIPVTERMPEEWVPVIVRSKYGFTAMEMYIGVPGKWKYLESDSVTHWMPLPEPPKEIDS